MLVFLVYMTEKVIPSSQQCPSTFCRTAPWSGPVTLTVSPAAALRRGGLETGLAPWVGEKQGFYTG